MWRAIPLAKMVLLMIGACIPLSIAEHLVYQIWPLYRSAFESYLDNMMWHAAKEGAYWGFALGIAMALFTVVLYRRIRKPTLYVFAMVIVATAVTIATQPISLPAFIQMTEQLPNGGIWLFAFLARSALMIIASLMVAKWYAAQAARRKSKKRNTEA